MPLGSLPPHGIQRHGLGYKRKLMRKRVYYAHKMAIFTFFKRWHNCVLPDTQNPNFK